MKIDLNKKCTVSTLYLDLYQGQESSQQTIRGTDDFLPIHEMLSLVKKREREREKRKETKRHQTSAY